MAEDKGASAAEKLTYLLIGAGIGATLALLFAPKSGRELRGEIVDATKRGIDAASQGARQLGERASDVYEQAKEKVSQGYEVAKQTIGQGVGTVSDIAARQKEQIAAAIEAGKQAYREEKQKALEAQLSAVENPEA
jgi:gas vesicle protein